MSISVNHVHMSFKYLYEQGLHHVSWQPFPILDNEDILHIQSISSPVQLEAISSCSITCCMRKEANTLLAAISFKLVVERDAPISIAAPHMFCFLVYPPTLLLFSAGVQAT